MSLRQRMATKALTSHSECHLLSFKRGIWSGAGEARLENTGSGICGLVGSIERNLELKRREKAVRQRRPGTPTDSAGVKTQLLTWVLCFITYAAIARENTQARVKPRKGVRLETSWPTLSGRHSGMGLSAGVNMR